MKLAAAAAASLSLCLAACTGAAPGVLGQAIINGTVDDGDTNVVLVFAQVPGQSTGSLCTGEVVSPHVVLTAAHCMAPSTVGAGAQFVVFTGTMLPTTGRPPANELLGVSESHYVPTFSYDTNSGADQDDVGVLILAQPTMIAPLPFNQYTLPSSAKGAAARIIGYGLSDGNDSAGTTAGTRRQAPTTVSEYQAQTLRVFDGMHANCEGDSGGPTLLTLDGKERIVGITQVGYVGCPVGMSSSDTRIDAYASFVDQYVTMFDPPAVAAGGACSSDGDCGALECIGGSCAQPCDPSASASMCPAGTQCSDVDGRSLCAKPSSQHHGCAIGGHAPIGSGVALVLLAALALLARSRRA
ncbi:MAG TPA: trypsin-like serine protease [Polyangia bacterium]|jgi:hypothetical protein|nr:trypsin-like serine protease [Polyangia bacterium]